MIKKTITLWMACLFLGSSVLLPLGDFSLMRDLPEMYRNYTRITSAEEMGPVDFIGDYLLHGKDIFGHNEHDKTPAKGCDVQFQHQASSLNIVLLYQPISLLFTPESLVPHPLFSQPFHTSDYSNELFRPPLA
jgi:hypothetical protein